MLYADPFLTVYCCLLAALLGACMGSFLNCAAWRIVHGESVLRGRSHCDACGHVLAVRDLIPVVSYLAAHGRCRYCGAKLSRCHVLAEAVSALVFVTLLLHYDISLQALEGWCVAGILLVCSFADLEGYIIPDRFIAVGVVLFIITLFFAPQPLRRALDGTIGGLAVAGCVLLLVLGMEKLLGREAMGGGDIKLAVLIGLTLGWLGWPQLIVGAFAAFFVGGIISIVLLALHKVKLRGGIPFGPSMVIGAWIGIYAGALIANWYLQISGLA